MAQVSLSGRVVERTTGESLPYASIILKASKTGTSTNLDGYFTLFNIPSDTSRILISYVGYEVIETNIKSLGSTEDVKIALSPLSTSLDEVLIKATSSGNFISTQEDVSLVRLSTKQISSLPSIGEVDIFRSLQLLPGVSGTNESSAGLYVRGGTPDQNLVVLDGMTVYKVDHFYGFFSAFNAQALKDVQLYKGGFPAKYGGRLSGVVNMTGKTGSFEKVKGRFAANLLTVNGFVEIPIGKKVSVLLAGRRSFTDVLQSDLYKKITGNFIDDDQQFRNLDFTELEPQFYFYDWNGKLSFRPSAKDLISFSIYNGKDYLDQSRDLLRVIDFGSNIAPRNAALEIIEHTNWGNLAGSLKWSRQWNKKWYSNILVAGSEFFSNYDIEGHFQLTIPSLDSLVNEVKVTGVEKNRVQETSITFDNDLTLSNQNTINFGASYTRNEIDYSAVRDDTVNLLLSDQESYIVSAWLADKVQIGSYLKAEIGIRGSYYALTEQYLFEPRLNLSVNLTTALKLKTGFGHYYQYANRIINETVTEGSREFWILADGDLIDVSSSTQFVLGASYETKNWLFDVEGYYKDLKGLNEYSLRYRESQDYVPEELFFEGDGKAQGFEFLIQKLSGPLSGWISYTLGWVAYDFPELNNGNPYYALHDQRHELKLVASYDIGSWSIASNFVYGSGKAFSEPEGYYTVNQLNGDPLQFTSVGDKNGSRLPPYHRLDLSVHHRFNIAKAKADIGVSLFNLYNRNNTWYYKYDFQQTPYLKTEVTYLGFTPNISFSIEF